MTNLTLGSLFDGSGGFPLGGMLSGINPIWASEIEPFPIRVTSKRIPSFKHLGDISTINGAEIDPVDIITFGSPCTDMSVAGKRAGLDGKQSVLFYEAIRIIKEMRSATNGDYPRFIVWENVPGAFSSNKGQDFKAVLESVCGVKDETVTVPEPPKGKWTNAGEILGSDYSVAWRTIDAQYFGVAQRRRRIYLVADFASASAGKILFESEGLSGHSSQSKYPWKGTPTNAEKSTGKAISFEPGAISRLATGHYWENFACTLRADMGDNQLAVMFENHSQDTRYIGPIDVAQTVSATYGTGGNNQPFVVSAPLVLGERLQGLPITENLAQTIMATDYKGVQCVCEETPKTLKIRSGCDGGGKGALIQDDKSATLSCNNDQTVFVPKAYGICSDGSNSMKSDNPNSGIYEAETSRTLDANGGNPSCNQGGMAVVCIDQGGGKSSCNITEEQAPTLTCTHGGEPAVCIQGSVIGRNDKNGPNGSGFNEEVSFTLNTTDKHAVVYAIDRETFNCGQNFSRNLGITEDGVASTLNAQGPSAVAEPSSFYPQFKAESQCYRDDGISNTLVNGTNPGFQNGIIETDYTVRRLTPKECALLQGFPIWWCDNLETAEPTNEDIAFWSEVFETHRKIMGTSSKPKSRQQIIKWLNNPYSDSAEYKMWGNGVALPCVRFVLSGIVLFTQQRCK